MYFLWKSCFYQTKESETFCENVLRNFKDVRYMEVFRACLFLNKLWNNLNIVYGNLFCCHFLSFIISCHLHIGGKMLNILHFIWVFKDKNIEKNQYLFLVCFQNCQPKNVFIRFLLELQFYFRIFENFRECIYTMK